MNKNDNPTNSEETIEDLLQQLKDSQGPGDALISIGGQGPMEVTTQHGTIQIGGDSKSEDVEQELIQKAYEEVLELGKKQVDLTVKYGRRIIMQALMMADKEVFEYHQQKTSENTEDDSAQESFEE